MSAVPNKHDADCLRRKVEMDFPYLCTCDMTDDGVHEAAARRDRANAQSTNEGMNAVSEATATLLDTYVDLTRRKRELEAEVNLLKKQIAPIEAELLDEYAAEGVRRKDSLNGTAVFLTRKIWARATDLGKPAACEALKRAGLGDYVELGFNTNSLSAYFRERAAALQEQTGAPVPLDEVLPAELRDAIALTEDHKLSVRI